ncbi:MAG: membrane protein insertase YidC [Acidobacteria bacterium]|nr:membrane protein insertase YidC [Acidobacteriota bacterium]
MPEKDDQFVQQRLLAASVLSGLLVMGYFWYQSRNAPPPPEPQAIEQSVEQTSEQPQTPAPDAASGQAPSGDTAAEGETPAAPEAQRAAAEQIIVVETDTFIATFSNRGAVVTSWVLKNFQDSDGSPLNLVHAEGRQEFGAPFSLLRLGGAPIPELDKALFVVNDGPSHRTAPETLEFRFTDGSRRATKTFRFSQEGYLVDVSTTYFENGAAQPHLIAWPGGFGDTGHQQDWMFSKTFYQEPSDESIEFTEADDAEDTRITARGLYPFAGIEDHFFTAIFLPKAGEPITVETSAVEIAPAPGVESKETYAALAVGSEGRNEFQVYVGPKDVDELQKVRPSMRNVVDFGWFSFVAEPLFLFLRWVHDNVVANWGWSIIIVTVVINLALFPLKWKGSKSMKRMQQIQPLVAQINEKYKGLGMTDPRKQKQNEEVMELYSKYKVNPVGGCLPMVLQLPFFYGFYKVLTLAIEMRHAHWLWVSDLSQPETLAIRILPLTMMATQFWMQSLTPTPSVDPAQARIMKFMPLMMGFIFYQFSAGLVLYWLTGNLVGVAQQVLLNKLPGEELDIAQDLKRTKKRSK